MKNCFCQRLLFLGVQCFIVVHSSLLLLYGQTERGTQRRLFSPTALLIRDEAIRFELEVTKNQLLHLEQVCDELDPLLFAMRDVPANTVDPRALARGARITEILNNLDSILNSSQRQRLEQLCLQYEGVEALFYPRIQSKLKFTSAQSEKLRQIRHKSINEQQTIQQKSLSPDQTETKQEIEKIQRKEMNQIMQILNAKQQQQWLTLLGEAFNFAQTSPVSFRVPQLENVTQWINTEPLSMRDLRGRVVIVHFWTFGCQNCVQNYPVYRQWARQYDPKEVYMLGIHTPEANYEKDITALRQRMQQEQLSFTVAVDNDKTNWQAWSNQVWPSVYLVDKKGRVRYWWYGELRWQGATGDKWIAERIEELKSEQYP